jgi:creatinine amidohydrolase
LMEALTLTRIPRKQAITIILPTGSLEYHGGLMPLGTDTIIAYEIARHCARESHGGENIVVLPPLPYGYSHEWLKYGDTISLDPVTYMMLIDNLISAIMETWPQCKLRIVNGHGGNKGILEAVVRKHWANGKDVRLIDIWKTASRYGLEYCHACDFEAELLSYLTGRKYSGVKETVEPGEEYIPGSRGRMSIGLNDFLQIICGEITG